MIESTLESNLEPVFGDEKERILSGYRRIWGSRETLALREFIFFLPETSGFVTHYLFLINGDLYRVRDILKDWAKLTGNDRRTVF